MISKLIIKEAVYRKVMHFVDKAPGEVSGLGSIEIIDGIPVVTDAWMTKQANTSGSTDLDADDVARLMYEQRDKDLRWWWHSHVNMGVFWSGTDEAAIKELGGNGWFTATVFNKKRELKSAILSVGKQTMAFEGIEKPVVIFKDDVPTQLLSDIPLELINKWDEEYTKSCPVAIPRNPFYLTGKKEARRKWKSIKKIVAEWSFEEKQESGLLKQFQADQCCYAWEKFIAKHKDIVEAALNKLELEETEQEMREPVKAISSYSEVKDMVEDLYTSSYSVVAIEWKVKEAFGDGWDTVVQAIHDRLSQDWPSSWLDHGGFYGN